MDEQNLRTRIRALMAKDTGADVAWSLDEGDIGFQVTEFHSDKGLAANQRGSQLRRAEKAKAASGRPYAMSVGLNPIPALVSAIAQKVGRAVRPDRQRFRKVLLVIAASLPHDGVGATIFLDATLEPKLPHLNAATHDLLSDSSYDSAYIFNMLSLEGTSVIYEWERNSGWSRRGPASSNERYGQSTAESDNAGLQTIRLLRSFGGPRPGAGSLTDGLGPDFLSELLEAFAHREPAPHEIEAFERSYRERHRKLVRRSPSRA